MAQQAQDTFVAELPGGPLYVQKGQVYADGHAVVKLDGGRGMLFKPLDLGEEDEKPDEKRSPRRAPGKASS